MIKIILLLTVILLFPSCNPNALTQEEIDQILNALNGNWTINQKIFDFGDPSNAADYDVLIFGLMS